MVSESKVRVECDFQVGPALTSIRGWRVLTVCFYILGIGQLRCKLIPSSAAGDMRFAFLHSTLFWRPILLKHASVACFAGHIAPRTIDLQDGLSWMANTASFRDSLVCLVTWSAQCSGGRPLGRRHDEGVVKANMSMAWLPGCGRYMCPKAPMRSLRIIVVSGDCPVRVRIKAVVT